MPPMPWPWRSRISPEHGCGPRPGRWRDDLLLGRRGRRARGEPGRAGCGWRGVRRLRSHVARRQSARRRAHRARAHAADRAGRLDDPVRLLYDRGSRAVRPADRRDRRRAQGRARVPVGADCRRAASRRRRRGRRRAHDRARRREEGGATCGAGSSRPAGWRGRAERRGPAERRPRGARRPRADPGGGVRSDARSGCRRSAGRGAPARGAPAGRKVTMDDDRLIEAAALDPQDREFDVALRPKTLAEFVGQERVKEQLALLLDGARRRGEVLDHLLFRGPPGLGTTTLAQIVSNEMAAGFQPTSGPALDRPSDLAAILTNLDEGDVLFVDEIHRMPRAVEEVLYPALEDFKLDVVLGKGPSARSIRLDLPRFTMVAATTRPGRITLPLRERFGFSPRLDYYSQEELTQVANRSARILRVAVQPHPPPDPPPPPPPPP